MGVTARFAPQLDEPRLGERQYLQEKHIIPLGFLNAATWCRPSTGGGALGALWRLRHYEFFAENRFLNQQERHPVAGSHPPQDPYWLQILQGPPVV